MKMREIDESNSNWFSKWEEQLPSPDELIPLSQTLITPDLALAFNIRNPISPPPPPIFPPANPNSSEFDSSGGGVGGGDEPARTLKRPRLVWTPQLHKRFVDAVAHLGIKNAVPKTIMQLMSVDGLTRENVASHLQKYRLYLKRMQGLNNNSVGSGDSATDRLFASGPVPAHFLGPGGRSNSNSEHFMPYMAAAALHHQQQQQYQNPQVPGQYQRQMAHFEQNSFLTRQAQAQAQAQAHAQLVRQSVGYNNAAEDVESGTANNGGRKVLTLFPNGGD